MNLLYYLSIFTFFVSFQSCKDHNQNKKTVENPIIIDTIPKTVELKIKDFFTEKKYFGEVKVISSTAKWENGPRYLIKSSSGMFKADLDKNNDLVCIWKVNSNNSYEQVYLDETLLENSYPIVEGDGYSYKILDKTKLISGKGVYADVLLYDVSVKADKGRIESILREIMKNERFISISGYTTKEAFKANWSESYAKKHPNAKAKGLLGFISEEGIFLR